MATINIREFNENDVPQVLNLMKCLAKFEGYIDDFKVTQDDLLKFGLSKNPKFKVFVACKDTTVLGIAVTYISPWTYDLLPTVTLKELFVSSQARSKGIGQLLMKKVTSYAKSIDAPRIQWAVLSDNEKAKKFYQNLGAKTDKKWQAYGMNKQSMSLLTKGVYS